jgi:hypothetical protein
VNGVAKKKRDKESVYSSNNVLSDGMNPPIAADELVNKKIEAYAASREEKKRLKAD